jgi:hypothetical protein
LVTDVTLPAISLEEELLNRIPAPLAKFVPAREVMLTVVFVSPLDGVIDMSVGADVFAAATHPGTSGSRRTRQSKSVNRFIPVLPHQIV